MQVHKLEEQMLFIQNCSLTSIFRKHVWVVSLQNAVAYAYFSWLCAECGLAATKKPTAMTQ
jgi:hypothetical protein